MTEPTSQAIDDFITRWQTSGAAERANFPQFIVELCDLIGVPHPDPTTPYETQNSYVFEKAVPLPHGTTGRIDLYKRGCFVLEAKQGSDQKEADTTTFSEAALRQQQRRKRGTAVRGTAGTSGQITGRSGSRTPNRRPIPHALPLHHVRRRCGSATRTQFRPSP